MFALKKDLFDIYKLIRLANNQLNSFWDNMKINSNILHLIYFNPP